MPHAITRKELLKIWTENNKYNDRFICPDCRDILLSKDTLERGIVLKCANGMCRNEEYYNIKSGEQL